MDTTTKHCPGARIGGQQIAGRPAHEAPRADFAKNAAHADGLSRVCRNCWRVYELARKAVKAGAAVEYVLAHVASDDMLPTGGRVHDLATPAGQYHDELARKAHAGKVRGYTAEVVDGIVYALPDGATVSTPEGQAALEAVNEARARARRKRDAERKRNERAAAKARALEAAAPA